ncbi:MAG: hypothetical protein GWN67_14770 [Phycisphaerae bacterium]|nr:hypothetical protein [Phycisphaerae bacterium]NIP52827.1 hypothetical protein [Phycisphaerae bacterium]NIS51848.1 hypothetical protein [Phycisphaerae bacterium]NIU09366.1 hypothetical protein [Phycisphaerae bacterium]NIU57599.1 hypothetical protein [Phycisphaerae bacterium]
MRRSGKLHLIFILRKALLIMLVMCVLRNCCFARLSGTDLNKLDNVDAYIDKLTGFETLEQITKSFRRVDVNDDNTPFLHRQINGKKNVWRIKIKNVRLKLKSAIPGFKDRYLRTFEVLIDPNTGHLLRITSTCDVNDPNMLPEPPAKEAEIQLMRMGEIYHGFPAEPPKINFLDALDAVLSKGIGSPFLAKEFYGLYVMESRGSAQPRPVWAITLRGIPPRPLKAIPTAFRHLPDDELVPVWVRNHIRNVVDDVTGQVLFATSCPQPVRPEEKKKK